MDPTQTRLLHDMNAEIIPSHNHALPYTPLSDISTHGPLTMYNWGLRMQQKCWEHFSRHRLQRKLLVSDPGIHYSTCIMHMPWCMPWCIPGACAICNFTYGNTLFTQHSLLFLAPAQVDPFDMWLNHDDNNAMSVDIFNIDNIFWVSRKMLTEIF